LAASPQKSRKSRSDELIAGWKALKQTLRACLKACFKISESKQTCDSDGKVSKFIDLQDVTRHAFRHRLRQSIEQFRFVSKLFSPKSSGIVRPSRRVPLP